MWLRPSCLMLAPPRNPLPRHRSDHRAPHRARPPSPLPCVGPRCPVQSRCFDVVVTLQPLDRDHLYVAKHGHRCFFATSLTTGSPDSDASFHTTPPANKLSHSHPPLRSHPSSIIVGKGPILLVTSIGDLVLPNDVLVAPHMI
jgi:hypothetical protein